MKKAKNGSAIKEEAGENGRKKTGLPLAIKLALSFVFIVGTYFAAIKVGEIMKLFLIQKITLITYIAAATVLGSLYVIFNKGVSNDVPEAGDLPDEWSREEKELFIEKRKKDREKAKKVLIFLLPVIVALLIDVINVFYF